MDFCLPFPDVGIAVVARLLQEIKELTVIKNQNLKSRIHVCSCVASLRILLNLLTRMGQDVVHEELAALSSAMIKQRIQAGVVGTGHIPICITALNLTSVVLALRR
jgi:hypothetical protein